MNDETHDSESKKTSEEDSEYQYSGEDYSGTYGEGQKTGKGGFLGWMARHRILVIVIAVVLVFAIYKLISVFLTSADKPKKTTPITATRKNQTKTITQIKQPVRKRQVVTPQVRSFTPTTTQASTARMKRLEDQVNNMSQQLSQLNETVNSLSANLANVSDAMQNINSNVQALATHVSRLSKVEKRKSVRAKKVTPKRAAPKPPQFFVEALIPGRAWIKSADGETLTVGVGDKIPGHGVVRVIDIPNGKVITSTGDEIHYAVEEN